jgi:hypothetical protein
MIKAILLTSHRAADLSDRGISVISCLQRSVTFSEDEGSVELITPEL